MGVGNVLACHAQTSGSPSSHLGRRIVEFMEFPTDFQLPIGLTEQADIIDLGEVQPPT